MVLHAVEIPTCQFRVHINVTFIRRNKYCRRVFFFAPLFLSRTFLGAKWKKTKQENTLRYFFASFFSRPTAANLHTFRPNPRNPAAKLNLLYRFASSSQIFASQRKTPAFLLPTAAPYLYIIEWWRRWDETSGARENKRRLPYQKVFETLNIATAPPFSHRAIAFAVSKMLYSLRTKTLFNLRNNRIEKRLLELPFERISRTAGERSAEILLFWSRYKKGYKTKNILHIVRP